MRRRLILKAYYVFYALLTHTPLVRPYLNLIANIEKSSIADPDLNPDPNPPDPHVFEPPGSGSVSISQRYGSGSGSFYH
jgi:hypothetical protein